MGAILGKKIKSPNENNSKIVSKKIKNENIICYACYEVFTPNLNERMCTNEKCVESMCDACVKIHYYLPYDHRGNIDRSKVICGYCQTLINPKSKNISPFIKELFYPRTYKHEGNIIANNVAEMLQLCNKMWKCNSLVCHSDYGIFCVEKIRCGIEIVEENQNFVEDDKKYCQKCIEYELKNDIEEWRILGFDTFTGLPSRICPGCKERYERIEGTCPRLYCIKCGSHFCYCCGNKFLTPNYVYEHLKKEYGTYFPSNENIKEYLNRQKRIKEWRKNLPDDISDKEAEIMMNDDNSSFINAYEYNKLCNNIAQNVVFNLEKIKKNDAHEIVNKQLNHALPLQRKNQKKQKKQKKEKKEKTELIIFENPKKRTKEKRNIINRQRFKKNTERMHHSTQGIYRSNREWYIFNYGEDKRILNRELKKKNKIENLAVKKIGNKKQHIKKFR